MMPALSHAAAAEMLEAAALDVLSPEDQERVVAHSALCAECGPQLSALRESLAMLAYAAPANPVEAGRRAGMRARLVARAAADRGAPAVPERPAAVPGVPAPHPLSGSGAMPTILTVPMALEGHSPSRGAATPARGVAVADFNDGVNAARWMRSHVLALAASIAFVVSTGVLAFVIHDRSELQTSYDGLSKWVSTLTARLDSANASLAVSTRLVGALSGARVKVVELTSAGPATPSARMFWNQATNRWTMFAYNLAAPAPGRTYQLWLVTSHGIKISAGTFSPSPQGDAMVAADYPLAPDALDAIAVTDEPSGGVPQPTGAMVLVGRR